MNHLEQTLLQSASGEHRFDPDQQRQYLGTFRERVILALEASDLTNVFLSDFPTILTEITRRYPSTQLKLAGSLPVAKQLAVMKIANQQGIQATTVQDQKSTSNYVLIIHSDRAVNCDSIHLATWKTANTPSDSDTPAKPHFWQRLFKKG